MDISLFIILGVLFLFSALLYYVFIIKKERDIGSQGKAGIFNAIFVLTPIILIVLFMQSGAETRLGATGFNPHSSFSGSVGVATGSGKNPSWLFSTDEEPSSILEFYKAEINHQGWVLTTESPIMLIFKKETQVMSVSVNGGSVSFMLHKDK